MSTIINATTTNGVVIQPDNSGSLQLATNSGTTAVTIDTSQNVGIGTTSPSNLLDVRGSSAPQITLNNTSAVSNDTTDATIATYGGSTSYWSRLNYNSSQHIWKIYSSEKMRIDSNGDVGIGTTNPVAKLHVTHNGGSEFGTVVKVATVAGTDDPVISLENYNGGSPVRYGISCTDSGSMSFLSGAYEGAFGTANMSITSAGLLQFNSGYGSVATAYGCRAWVNFNGSANTNLSGTYARTSPSTTLTVTATAHGLIVGSSVNLDFTTGTGLDGIYTVVTVADANTFTVTTVASTTTSGNVTLLRNTIRASGNVSSITDNGTGDYTINFTTAMPDANYCAIGTTGPKGSNSEAFTIFSYTSSAVRINSSSGAGTAGDTTNINCAIFR